MVFISALLAVAAMTALLASSASASLVAAKFSSASFRFVGSGTITLKRNGIEAKTCELKTPLIGGNFGPTSSFQVGNGTFGEAKFTCPTGGTPVYLEMFYWGEAQYDNVTGAYSLRVDNYSEHTLGSPYGQYSQITTGQDRGSWTNGSGTTASTVTFNEALIGHDTAGKSITFTGTMKVTTSTGGLVTLSH